MKAEQQSLEKQIYSLKQQLQNLPEGKLLCARNENRYKWYQSDGKNHIYIPKKNRYLAEHLLLKRQNIGNFFYHILDQSRRNSSCG